MIERSDVQMIYNKQELERMRQEGLEYSNKMEEERQERLKGMKYKVNDIPIICVHCKYDKLRLDRAMLNTRGMTFMGWDWLNDEANTLICARCGYIHWFEGQVVKLKGDSYDR